MSGKRFDQPVSIHKSDCDCNAKRLERELGAWRTSEISIIQGQLRAFREAVSMKYKTEVGPDHMLTGWMNGTTLCMGCEQFPSEGNWENALPFYPGHGRHSRSCANKRSVLGTKKMRWMRGVFDRKLDRTDEYLLLTPIVAKITRCVRRLDGDNAWYLQFLNLCVGSPWKATARSTQHGPTIQQKDELASGKRAKRFHLRQNILDKYGRIAGCPGCVGSGQHTEECRARLEQEMVDTGDAI